MPTSKTLSDSPDPSSFQDDLTFGDEANALLSSAKGSFASGMFLGSFSDPQSAQSVRREPSGRSYVANVEESSPFSPSNGKNSFPTSQDPPHAMASLVDRIMRMERDLSPLRDLSNQVSLLRRDVDFLMSQKRFESPVTSQRASVSSMIFANRSDDSQTNGDSSHPIAALSAQVSGLTESVSQLMAVHQAQQPSPLSRPPVAPSLSASVTLSSRQASGSGSSVAPPGSPSVQERWLPITSLLAPQVAQALLRLANLPAPTKIQLKAIPCLVSAQKEDIVCQASSPPESLITYSLAAVVCVLSASDVTSCIVVCSSVERATVAQRTMNELGGQLGIRVGLALARSATEDAAMFQRQRPHVIVGTSQGVLDLLSMRVLACGNLRLLVLDEADVMVSTGQRDMLLHIMRLMPYASPPNFDPWGDKKATAIDRQTAIFGAVIHPELLSFASALQLKEPVRVLVKKAAAPSASAETSPTATQAGDPSGIRLLKHHYLYVAIANRPPSGGTKRSSAADSWKLEAVADFVEDGDFSQAIAFCATPEAVEALSFKLASRGVDALALNDEMGPQTRASILSKFRSPSTGNKSKKVLVVLDALCRTLSELHPLPMVLNFDTPSIEGYAHQAGRALAPNGTYRTGAVVNVCCSDDDIQRLRTIEGVYGIRLAEVPFHRDF